MKKLLITLLLLIPCFCNAGVSQIMVTKVKGGYATQTYGVDGYKDGAPKILFITDEEAAQSKVQAFANFFTQNNITRYLIYFKGDGSVDSVDIQLADPFKVDPTQPMKPEAQEDLDALKIYIESAKDVKVDPDVKGDSK